MKSFSFKRYIELLHQYSNKLISAIKLFKIPIIKQPRQWVHSSLLHSITMIILVILMIGVVTLFIVSPEHIIALMTPAFAGFGIYIAYQQKKIAHEKLKLDLFDKRMLVYQAISDFREDATKYIGSIRRPSEMNLKNAELNDLSLLRKFRLATSNKKWLFNEEIEKAIDELDKQVQDLMAKTDRLINLRRRLTELMGEEINNDILVSEEEADKKIEVLNVLEKIRKDLEYLYDEEQIKALDEKFAPFMKFDI